MDAWATQWKQAIAEVRADHTHDESSALIRKLEKKRLLLFTDIRDNPERFFLAFRLLAERSPEVGPGFITRLNVHFNLFGGTVMAVGSPEQVAMLDEMQEKGLLGCFALTEKLAGVKSGAVVNTTAFWDESKNMFRIDTPTEGSQKNWISQGYTADKAVVIADLHVGGKSCGPNGFIIDLRKDGQVTPGIELGDMGQKTVGNDLDNAWIKFTSVMVPKSALLSRYSDIIDGVYESKAKGITTMGMIGQRLFTGRVTVAQQAQTFAMKMLNATREYADAKMCPSGKGEVPLSDLPQLRSLFSKSQQRIEFVTQFLNALEKQLNVHLRNNTIPPTELQDAIAVGKVTGVETAIDICFRLRQEVGSYALMSNANFGQTDYLQMCKFAEGDCRILMQKMARDRVRSFGKGPAATPLEDRLSKQLKEAMDQRGAGAWDEEWETVYSLADAICEATMERFVPKGKL